MGDIQLTPAMPGVPVEPGPNVRGGPSRAARIVRWVAAILVLAVLEVIAQGVAGIVVDAPDYTLPPGGWSAPIYQDLTSPPRQTTLPAGDYYVVDVNVMLVGDNINTAVWVPPCTGANADGSPIAVTEVNQDLPQWHLFSEEQTPMLDARMHVTQPDPTIVCRTQALFYRPGLLTAVRLLTVCHVLFYVLPVPIALLIAPVRSRARRVFACSAGVVLVVLVALEIAVSMLGKQVWAFM